MTRVVFFKKGRYLTGFCAIGHAGFAFEGKDIVCAGISVLTQTSQSAILELTGVKPDVVSNAKLAVFQVKTSRLSVMQQRCAHTVFAFVRCGLMDLQKQYPRYVRVLSASKLRKIRAGARNDKALGRRKRL